uniref:Uncharacterized protein n=1 Tax=Arundo donax TaxID=35708 RepID=A0A0A9ABD4_ARUDO
MFIFHYYTICICGLRDGCEKKKLYFF